MLSLGMKFFTDVPLTIVGLALFVFSFVMVLAQIYLRRDSKEYYQKVAELPLQRETT